MKFFFRLLVGAAFAAAPLLPHQAIGNDTELELSTGGLMFKKNPFIKIHSEDLFISTEEIRVIYKFFNNSNADITMTVAFPMPDITMSEDYQEPRMIPSQDPENFLDFVTIASGKRVSALVDQRVFARGVDQSALLRRLGVRPTRHLEEIESALKRPAPSDSNQLKELGLLSDLGNPQWTLKTTFFWNQTFPARRNLEIQHRYKPSVGGSVVTGLSSNPRYYEQKYCTDKDFLDTVTRARRAAQADYPPFTESWISYILTTGANWAGPIRSFNLIVDKGKPSNLLSFCANGVRKISPTQFQVKKTNFTPKSDLAILILEPTNR